MPLVPAAGYNYRPFPSEAPLPQAPSTYQTERASPEDFGAQTGQALERLGGAFDRAGTGLAEAAVQRQSLFNQVAVDEQVNNVQEQLNKVLYGDPAVPGDVGYFGKRGRDAIVARPIVQQQVNDIINSTRAGLQNPMQAIHYDNETRRLRIFTYNDIGRHYDNQFDKYAADTATAKVKLAENDANIAANNNDETRFNQIRDNGIVSISDSMGRLGAAPEAIKAAQESFVKKVTEDRVRAMAINDPLRAQQYAEAHKDVLGDHFDNVMGTVRTGAAKQQAIEDWTGVSGNRTGYATPPAQYDQTVAQAATQYNVPKELLTRVIHAESNFNPTLTSPTGAHGIAQFITSTAQKYGVDRDDPTSSIMGAAHYLSDLRKQTGSWQSALAGYLGSDPWKDPSYTGKGAIQLAAALDHGQSPTGQLEVWGDSLGVGLQSQMKVPGQVHGGDTPTTIFKNIQAQPEDYWKGKTIVLPSGSNGQEMPVVDQTIDYLKSKGANVIAVGYGPKFPDKNAKLQEIAQRRGVPVVAAEDVSAVEGVHPSPSGYASMAQKIAQARPADQVVGLPPHEDGEAPDAEIPGLTQRLADLSKQAQAEGWSADRFMNAVKTGRQAANAAYSMQQHARQQQKAQDEDNDEAIQLEYENRMYKGSPNYPTTDEVALDRRIRLSATKRTITGFIERQTRPDPLSRVSAQNQMDLFRRIHEKDDSPDKIWGQEAINQEYINGGLTDTARKSLIEDLKEVQGSKTKELATQKTNLLKAIEAKIIPTLAFTPRDKVRMLDPEADERVLNWKNAVDDKIKEYFTANKNPRDLFVKGKPDYVGSDEFLQSVGALGTMKQRVEDKPAIMMPNPYRAMTSTVPQQAPADLSTANGIKDAWAKGLITKEQGLDAARKLGILKE